MNSKLIYLIMCVFKFLPETSFFDFKNFLLRIAGAKIGNNVRICSSVKILGTSKLDIGDNTWIGPKTFIYASNEIKIGSNVDIAPRVLICAGTHHIDEIGAHTAGEGYTQPIMIEDGVWICQGVNIISGVKIGKKALIGAGALVNKDVDAYDIVGGVPCKVIRSMLR